MVFAAAFLAVASYSFGPGSRASYDVKVLFNGFLPILGGRQAKAEMSMSVEVYGLDGVEAPNLRASSDIKKLSLVFNGATMPFSAANVKEYFPKTTIDLSPQGRILKTDAPDVKLPVRLPGLDAKRFPDITYLPIEFPVGGIEEGKAFKFKKAFGDSEVDYEVTPTKIEGNIAILEVKLGQKYTTFEDAGRNPTAEDTAETRISTDLTGSGTAKFDLKRGLLLELNVQADALGHAVNIKSNESKERKLRTTLTIALATK